MPKKHYSIQKHEPDMKYKCKNVFLTQAVSQKDGSLKMSEISLPSDNNVLDLQKQQL